MPIVKIYSEVNGDLLIDFKYAKRVPRHSLVSLQLDNGQYFVRFSSDNPLLFKEEIVSVDRDCVVQIKKDDLMSRLTDTQVNGLKYVHKQLNGKHWVEELVSGLIISNEYDSIGRFEDGLCVVWKDNLCGFINKRGEEIIPCKYESFGMSKYGLSTVKLNNHWGAADNRGQFVIPVQYDFCKPRNDGEYWDVSKDGTWEIDWMFGERVYSGGKWGVCNKIGQEIVPCAFERSLIKEGDYFIGRTSMFRGGVTVFRLNGTQLFSNINFQELRLIEGDTSLYWMKKDSKWGIVGMSGFFVVPNEYDDFKEFMGNTCPVKQGDKWGVINKNGEVIQSCCFDTIEAVKDFSKYKVSINKAYGLLDGEGKYIVRCLFDSISVSLSYAVIKQGGKYGVIHSSAGYVISRDYDSIYFCKDTSVFICKREGKKGVFNYRGDLIIPFMYDDIQTPINKLYVVKNQEKYGIVSDNGKSITGLIYDDIKYTSGIGFCVKANGLWGVIDENGHIRLPIKYYYIGESAESLYPVNIGGKEEDLWTDSFRHGDVCGDRYPGGVVGGQWGFIDYNSKEVIPCQFDGCRPFYKNLSVVQKDNKMGVIDRSGNVVVPLQYSYCSVLSETMFLTAVDTRIYEGESEYDAIDSENPIFRGMFGLPERAQRWNGDFDYFVYGGKYGVYSYGKEIISPAYDRILPSKDMTLFVVIKDKKYGVIDITGRILVEIAFDFIELI